MAKPRTENYNERELRIVGVPKNKAQEIKNIASHMGVAMSDLLKSKLPQIIESYPPHMRTAPLDKAV
jgi:hypothetical protein